MKGVFFAICCCVGNSCFYTLRSPFVASAASFGVPRSWGIKKGRRWGGISRTKKGEPELTPYPSFPPQGKPPRPAYELCLKPRRGRRWIEGGDEKRRGGRKRSLSFAPLQFPFFSVVSAVEYVRDKRKAVSRGGG